MKGQIIVVCVRAYMSAVYDKLVGCNNLERKTKELTNVPRQKHWRLLFGDFLGLNFLNEFLKKVLNLLLGF